MEPLPDAPPPYRTVVFDCDSTLSAMEGIEALAGPEHREAIERMTAAAMAGEVPLEEVFGHRLELIRPTRADVERIGALYVEQALPGAHELFGALHSAGKRVVIVSGGLLPAVRRLADELGADETHAVDVRFDAAGAYADFDRASPLARAGGKIDVLQRLDGRPLAFVGDGATDLEAAHLAARFVAFGGVERRPAVFAAARVTCDSPDLFDLAPLLMTDEELARVTT